MASLEPLILDGAVPYPDDIAERYRREGYWTDQTHAELLFDAIAQYPERTAVIAGDLQLTYAELGEQILRLAAGLQALGIVRGDRIVMQLPNRIEYLPFMFAIFEVGAIPVLALAAHQRNEIKHFVDLTDARAYVTVDSYDGSDLGTLAAELEASSPALEHTIVLPAVGGGTDLERLLDHPPLAHERRSLPQDIAFLQLSGGTTGTSKLIPHTHEAYLSSVREAVRVGGVTGDAVQLVVLPMPHAFAMRSPGFLGALSVGATIVLAPDGSPDTVFPLIERYRITETALVPPLALAWLNSSLKDRRDLTSLRVLRVGGAKFSAEAARRVRTELGATLQQSFGMAEGLATFTGLDDDEETIVTRQGKPTSSADEVRIVDDAGDDVPPGQPGDLLTRGIATIRGYYRAPELNAHSFTADGFYRTGDIVRQDERGYLTIVGRSKDQINRGGEKIAPEEVENLLLANDSVHDVSVIGVPDEILGERIKALIVPRKGTELDELTLSSVRSFLRERGLASYKLPDLVDVVEKFQSTAAGKVSKRSQRSS